MLSGDPVQALAAAVKSLCFCLNRATAGACALPANHRELLETLAEKGPQTVPQLARGRGTSRQNIQILVNRLLQSGSIELVKNPGHKRSFLVQLTHLGNRMLMDARNLEDRLLAGILPQSTEAAVIEATALLRQVQDHLELRRHSHVSGQPRLQSRGKLQTKRLRNKSSRSEEPLSAEAASEEVRLESELPVNLL